jgi:cell division protein FtsI (penicillin-binding protein 3)
MASTIANGGMYLPPHILLESTGEVKGDGRLEPAAFHPGTDLPDPLPEGAHRVISTLTAAEMRKIMEGVVTEGTARGVAQLNGYSAGGKTGTAQKIDPRTHTYSKTKFVASFVGFAPVNDPAVTIAVIMDSPDHSMHFGAEASAPVFHDLAQQILEYLGVPHDEPLKSPDLMAKAQREAVPDEEPQEHVDDLDSLFAEVNNLPADDPLRASQTAHKQAPISKDELNKTAVAANTPPPVPAPKPAAAVADIDPHVLRAKAEAEAQSAEQDSSPSLPVPHDQPVNSGSVILAAGKRVAVPSFSGEPVRRVVEQAGGMGLGVQVLGTGIARDQYPAAGTMVPEGTAVVVRFGR